MPICDNCGNVLPLMQCKEIGTGPAQPPPEPKPPLGPEPGQPLSPRATTGFLERTKRGCLRFPAGFLEALRVHQRRVQAAAVDSSSVGSRRRLG